MWGRRNREDGARKRGLAALLVLLLASGCYFLRYEALVRTHVDLMTAMTAKRHDLLASGELPGNPAEWRYPLERARDFARIVGGRFGDRESYARFGRFVDRYEGLAGEESAETLEAGLEDLRRLRAEVLEALDAE